MKIILKRKIPVKSYETIMELAINSDEHRFYLRVLELAQESGFINQKMVNEKLLFRNADNVMGKRVLELLDKLGFIEGKFHFNYNLSSIGQLLRARYYNKNKSSTDYELLEILQDAGYVKITESNNGNYSFERTEEGDSFFDNEFPKQSISEKEERVFELLKMKGILEINESKKATHSINLRYMLTSIGNHTVSIGIVRIPEEGFFVINTTEDPLISEKIIGYSRSISNSSNEFQKYSRNNNDKNKQENKIATPKLIKNLQDELRKSPKIIKLIAQNYEEIQINKIGDEVSSIKPRLNVFISLKISMYGNVEMTLKSKNKEFIVKNDLDLKFDYVLEKLLDEKFKDIEFISREPMLLVAYDELKSSEKNSFIRSILIKKPEIEDYGIFDDVYLSNLKIAPKTVEDAKLWTNWIIEDQIKYYVDESEYTKIRSECANKFQDNFQPDEIISMLPCFEDFVHTLSNQRENSPHKYWFVTAPQFLTTKR